MVKNNKIRECKNWKEIKNYNENEKVYSNIGEKKLNFKDKLKEITIDFQEYNHIKWRKWQNYIIHNILNITTPNSRSILWFYNTDGNVGKTFLANYLVMKYNAIKSNGKKSDLLKKINLYLKQEKFFQIIILDIPRIDIKNIDYSIIELIKDGCLYIDDNDTEPYHFPPPHILIFANEFPKTKNFSYDRWKIYEITNDETLNIKKNNEKMVEKIYGKEKTKEMLKDKIVDEVIDEVIDENTFGNKKKSNDKNIFSKEEVDTISTKIDEEMRKKIDASIKNLTNSKDCVSEEEDESQKEFSSSMEKFTDSYKTKLSN